MNNIFGGRLREISSNVSRDELVLMVEFGPVRVTAAYARGIRLEKHELIVTNVLQTSWLVVDNHFLEIRNSLPSVDLDFEILGELIAVNETIEENIIGHSSTRAGSGRAGVLRTADLRVPRLLGGIGSLSFGDGEVMGEEKGG